MMLTNTRKRKLTSLDADTPVKKGASSNVSPVRRRSPRKKPVRVLNKEKSASPQKSQHRAAEELPSKSPFKASVVTSSFYGKQKAAYLTPLERKAIKESRPSAPLPPPPPSPPSQEEKKEKKKRRNKKNVTGGGKLRKVVAGSTKAGKTSLKRFNTSVKTIKLSNLNSSNISSSGVTAKPPSKLAAAPASSTKGAESKKAITISFSSLKPKPKIFVGAAFFSTGKKPTSMYKKFTPKSSNKPGPGPMKSNPVPSQTKPERSEPQPSAPVLKNQQKKRPAEAAVLPEATKEKTPSTKQRTKFDPLDWMDSVDEQSEISETLSSPKSLAEKHGITKKLMIVLTRTPSPRSAPRASGLSAQDVSLSEGGSEPVFDLNVSASPLKGSTALYPIFGSAAKRSSKALQPPVPCSASSGSIMSLQTTSLAKEQSVRRRKEKQDDDQLIIDAGQKQFGAITCSSCGMLYSADNPEDNFQHTQFHQRFVDSIKFVGWKKERVVAEFWDGKILLVMPDDPKYAIRKAEEVRRVADNELGFQQVTLSRPTQAKTYLFINMERVVVGCLVAEHIRQAYRVLDQPDQQKDMMQEDFMEHHRAWCCSTVPEQALCGISRIWVFSLARRQNIATRMLDTVRSTFMYGSYLTKDEIAFSDPTPDGKLFATKYCNTPTFLVYNFIA